MDNNRVTIIVDSFDGYSDIWPTFFDIFKTYWKDCPFEIKLVSNEKTFDGVETILTGKETTWSDRTLSALKQVDTQYVLLLLEDYLLAKNVNSKQVLEAVDFLCKNNGKYLRFTNIPKSRFSNKNDDVFCLYEDEEYAVNLQASLWEKSFLEKSLKKYKGSAWNFEIGFLSETVDAPHIPLEGCYGLKNDPLNILNGVLKGKWFPSSIRYFKKRGFNIDWTGRGKLSFKQCLKYNISQYVKNSLSYSQRKILKKMLMKLGVKFVSNY